MFYRCVTRGPGHEGCAVHQSFSPGERKFGRWPCLFKATYIMLFSPFPSRIKRICNSVALMEERGAQRKGDVIYLMYWLWRSRWNLPHRLYLLILSLSDCMVPTLAHTYPCTWTAFMLVWLALSRGSAMTCEGPLWKLTYWEGSCQTELQSHCLMVS